MACGSARANLPKLLVVDDAQAILQQVPAIAMVSPEADSNAQVVYGNMNWATRVQGVGPDYFKIRNWPVVLGGEFSERDVSTAANVAVIGATVANNLFTAETIPSGEGDAR